MATADDRELVREVITGGRYLSLSTTDGNEPWVAPIEYMHDDELNFYFLSTDDARHSRHIEANPTVAVAIFEREQPEYSPDFSGTLRGVQIRGTAKRLSPDEYPEIVTAAIDALDPPMPPYRVYRIVPRKFYVPRVEDGVNERLEVHLRDD